MEDVCAYLPNRLINYADSVGFFFCGIFAVLSVLDSRAVNPKTGIAGCDGCNLLYLGINVKTIQLILIINT